jgi:thymidylate synthase
VVRARPLDCWEELVVRTVRFGRPVELQKGRRLELLNAKAVITDPVPERREALAAFGFDLDRFEEYQRRILSPELPDGISYTYGNRLRGHFGSDSLATAIELLRRDPETRGAYVSLWDTPVDLSTAAPAKPCLTTLFFRHSDGRLTLTATYRSHNLLTAWLENVYGLMAIQRHVADHVGMEPGSITVVSHSLGIDPASPRYDLARTIAAGWTRDDDVDRTTGKYSLREDPNGYFVVTVDRERGKIVAEHRFGGVLVKRYEGDRAVTIEQQVSADMAVSLVSHAMWLGRELTAKERLLEGGAADADSGG